jgi:hypothetical protein
MVKKYTLTTFRPRQDFLAVHWIDALSSYLSRLVLVSAFSLSYGVDGRM